MLRKLGTEYARSAQERWYRAFVCRVHLFCGAILNLYSHVPTVQNHQNLNRNTIECSPRPFRCLSYFTCPSQDMRMR